MSLDISTRGSSAPAARSPARDQLAGRSILVLQNPGRVSRHYLSGIVAALGRMGLRHCVLEVGQLWAGVQADKADLIRRLSALLVQHKVGAVLGYGHNGMVDVPLDGPLSGGGVPFLRSFWEVRNVPQLMLWLDHPQWHADRVGLRPELQPVFRSANNFHFLKSAAHALECERVMGWPNCLGLHAAIDPGQFEPATGVTPDYDVVAIMTEKVQVPGWMREFLKEDDPDVGAIHAVIAEEVRGQLRALWEKDADPGMRAELTALGDRWAAYKQTDPSLAAVRHWPRLVDEFPGACWYLTLTYPLYAAATRILWRFREWQRRFYAGYLAKYFRVGVWGGEWAELGLGPGGWVDFTDQAKVYARGKVALNLVDGHDEEGLTLKPFEIGASGVAMAHFESRGLEEVYEPGTEVAVFRTPREARERIAELVGDPRKRRDMAEAARARTLRDHTWDKRVEAMLQAARMGVEAFRG